VVHAEGVPLRVTLWEMRKNLVPGLPVFSFGNFREILPGIFFAFLRK
jgi:hypothetical protein